MPYVVQRRRKFWARFQVPVNVRDAFDGKREVWANLNTDDAKLAEARSYREASNFRAKVLEARGRAGTVEQDALDWRRQIDAEQDHWDVVAQTAIREGANRYVKGGYRAVQIAARHHDGREEEALREMGGPEGKTFVEILVDRKKPLLPFVDPWVTARMKEVEPRTAAMDETAVRHFVSAFPLLADVTKPAVAKWVEKRKEQVAGATTQREVSGLRAFWGYLVSHDEVDKDAPNPFTDLRFNVRKKDAARTKRQPFTAPEVSSLYAAALAKEDQELADLVLVAAYSGMRREELCALEIERVSKGWMKVEDAKTEAGWREVPIHTKAAPVLRRLIGKRTSGYVFAGLDADRYGKRGDAIGKRFTRLKQAHGHGINKTFHSIRRTVSTLLEGAKVPENLSADIIGHDKDTMTYGLYSGRGATRSLLPAALAKLAYPKPL